MLTLSQCKIIIKSCCFNRKDDIIDKQVGFLIGLGGTVSCDFQCEESVCDGNLQKHGEEDERRHPNITKRENSTKKSILLPENGPLSMQERHGKSV